MKLIINIVLTLLIVLLGYMMFHSINEPIKFQDFKGKRKNVVVSKLKEIRNVQEVYKEVVGMYANNFDSLLHVIANDSIVNEIIEGDPDDPENMDKIIRTKVYFSARDSVNAMGIDMSTLRYVPFTDNKKEFSMSADTIMYQSTKVPVLEVWTSWGTFMGEYADIKFSKYDQQYDPANRIKFGDMYKPVNSGNWE
jgi:hypothetical protein